MNKRLDLAVGVALIALVVTIGCAYVYCLVSLP
jgi:hypothetical protein